MILNVKRERIIVVSLFVAFTVMGCVTANFKEPITAFQRSIDTAGAAVGTYYAELNQFERDLYLEERLFNEKLEVLATDKSGMSTPLLGKTFSAESIKARTDAIILLGIYARRLAELAGSDAPARFSVGAKVLGENLDNLASTFSSLRNDATAPSYAGPTGPIATIIGVVGKMFLESKRDAALTVAIEQGAPEVTKVLQLLESDLVNVVGPLRQTGAKQILAERVTSYNKNRSKMNQDQRRQALEGIRYAAMQYEIAVAFNPSDLMRGMREAHEALVKYARSDRRPENLAELVSAMEILQNRVQVIAAAVQQLRDLRKEGR